MSFVSRAFKGRLATSRRTRAFHLDSTWFAIFPCSPPDRRRIRRSLADWTFSIEGEVDEVKHWTWRSCARCRARR